MNVREAILKAADHVEANPEDWDFYASSVPGSCGTPGCAVGWVAFFLGHRAGADIFSLSHKIFGVAHLDWWRQVMSARTELCDSLSGAELATKLRAYADKYHPAETPKHVGIPPSVRAIFDVEREPVVVGCTQGGERT